MISFFPYEKSISLTRVDETLEALFGVLLVTVMLASASASVGRAGSPLGRHPLAPRRDAAVERERAQRQLHRHRAQHADPLKRQFQNLATNNRCHLASL